MGRKYVKSQRYYNIQYWDENTHPCPYCGYETPKDKKLCMVCGEFIGEIDE